MFIFKFLYWCCFILIYNNSDLCVLTTPVKELLGFWVFFYCFYHFGGFWFHAFLNLTLFFLWTDAFIVINNDKQEFNFNSDICHVGKLNSGKWRKIKQTLETPPQLPWKSLQYFLLFGKQEELISISFIQLKWSP